MTHFAQHVLDQLRTSVAHALRMVSYTFNLDKPLVSRHAQLPLVYMVITQHALVKLVTRLVRSVTALTSQIV